MFVITLIIIVCWFIWFASARWRNENKLTTKKLYLKSYLYVYHILVIALIYDYLSNKTLMVLVGSNIMIWFLYSILLYLIWVAILEIIHYKIQDVTFWHFLDTHK